MHNTKKILICLLCVTGLLNSFSAFAAEESPFAKALNILFFFRGTESGYELDRIPTRSEALVMMIRLMGKEKEALHSSYLHPFKDTSWDDEYVSYGFHNLIVRGISNDTFGGGQESSAAQYCTMLLRVLGYSDENGDFSYDNAVSFASLALGEEILAYEKFDRGKMAELTCYALNTRIKDSSDTLGQILVGQGVFPQQTLVDAQRSWEQDETYASTTILIYAVGSDLESKQGRLSNDLKEILSAKPKENCRVLIQTGGTSQYQNPWMTGGKAERFLVDDGTLIHDSSEIKTSAAQGQTLRDFILWGVEKEPSQRYILVLWDHGYGVKGGFGADELNQNKTMKVSEISDAIASTGVFFDIVAFDACLMGTVETAYALRNSAKYMIASEEATPACGLYYTTWVSALERNPSISTQRLGRLVLESFTLHAGIEANIPTTMSMMKVNRAEALAEKISLYKGELLQAASKAELLGKNEGVFDQFDLLSLTGGTPEITAAVQALASEVRNSVQGRPYCGVALYVPVYKQEDSPAMAEELKKIGFTGSYLAVIFNDSHD